MLTLVLAIAVFATSALSAVFGMAGGLLLMGVVTLAVPVTQAMVIHGVAQLVSNTARISFLVRHVEWRIVLRYLLGALPAFVVLRTLNWVPPPAAVLLALGAIPFVARALPRSGWLSIAHPGAQVLCGLLVTGVQLLAGVAGPLLDVFFVEAELGRHQVVATKAATQVISHGLKIAHFGALLAPRELSWTLLAMLVPAAALGTFFGGRLLDRLSDARFRQVTRWLVLGLGGVYLCQGLVKLWS